MQAGLPALQAEKLAKDKIVAPLAAARDSASKAYHSSYLAAFEKRVAAPTAEFCQLFCDGYKPWCYAYDMVTPAPVKDGESPKPCRLFVKAHDIDGHIGVMGDTVGKGSCMVKEKDDSANPIYRQFMTPSEAA